MQNNVFNIFYNLRLESTEKVNYNLRKNYKIIVGWRSRLNGRTTPYLNNKKVIEELGKIIADQNIKIEKLREKAEVRGKLIADQNIEIERLRNAENIIAENKKLRAKLRDVKHIIAENESLHNEIEKLRK